MKYGGQIADFPQEVVEKMLERQVEQGREKDVSVFEYGRESNFTGFDWVDSPEGHNFWRDVIKYEKFDVFFAKYPKKQSEYPKVMLVGTNGMSWVKRVVLAERKGGFIALVKAETIEDSENEVETSWWGYAKDIEPESEPVELTIDEIADKFGIKPEQIKIKK